MRNRGEEFRILDRIPVRDTWGEIERRANESTESVHRYTESRARRLPRMTLAAGILMSFAAVAYLLLSTWRPATESRGVAGPGKESDAAPVTGEGENPPAIVKISDGYLLYEGEWQGIAWELVALPAEDGRQRCGNSAYVVAYRDAHGTDYQSCPEPFLAAETFSSLSGGEEGALVVGTVATDVASIQARTSDGKQVDGLVIPVADTIPASVNAFVMVVSAPYEGRLVAMNAEGVQLQVEPLKESVPIPPAQ
ncbi:MAG: hypothetical protein ACREA0_07925 [bacterium]